MIKAAAGPAVTAYRGRFGIDPDSLEERERNRR
jgi:hypothetical protein